MVEMGFHVLGIDRVQASAIHLDLRIEIIAFQNFRTYSTIQGPRVERLASLVVDPIRAEWGSTPPPVFSDSEQQLFRARAGKEQGGSFLHERTEQYRTV
jgi:hypothetical protein